VNYHEELAKLTVPELEEELRSMRSAGDALPEVEGNLYTSGAYRNYRRNSWISECYELLEAKPIEAINAKNTVVKEVDECVLFNNVYLFHSTSEYCRISGGFQSTT
jgi:hypothetical protein